MFPFDDVIMKRIYQMNWGKNNRWYHQWKQASLVESLSEGWVKRDRGIVYMYFFINSINNVVNNAYLKASISKLIQTSFDNVCSWISCTMYVKKITLWETRSEFRIHPWMCLAIINHFNSYKKATHRIINLSRHTRSQFNSLTFSVLYFLIFVLSFSSFIYCSLNRIWIRSQCMFWDRSISRHVHKIIL